MTTTRTIPTLDSLLGDNCYRLLNPALRKYLAENLGEIYFGTPFLKLKDVNPENLSPAQKKCRNIAMLGLATLSHFNNGASYINDWSVYYLKDVQLVCAENDSVTILIHVGANPVTVLNTGDDYELQEKGSPILKAIATHCQTNPLLANKKIFTEEDCVSMQKSLMVSSVLDDSNWADKKLETTDSFIAWQVVKPDQDYTLRTQNGTEFSLNDLIEKSCEEDKQKTNATAEITKSNAMKTQRAASAAGLFASMMQSQFLSTSTIQNREELMLVNLINKVKELVDADHAKNESDLFLDTLYRDIKNFIPSPHKGTIPRSFFVLNDDEDVLLYGDNAPMKVEINTRIRIKAKSTLKPGQEGKLHKEGYLLIKTFFQTYPHLLPKVAPAPGK